jgi:hypothetical protein
MTKKWYKSKTLWTNIVTGLVVIAAVFGVTPDEELAEQLTGILIIINPFVNMLLRATTDTALTVK